MQKTQLQRLSAAVFLSVLAATSVAAQSPPSINASGLPWASGVTRPVEAFAAWRGRPVDVRTVFFARKTWESIRSSANARPGPTRLAIGFGMLPNSHAGQLEACAAGAFDAQMRGIRDKMLVSGWKGAYIRLGWEANRVTRSLYPWAAKGNGNSYVGCFRRWVGILNPGGVKNFPIVWNMANEGTFPGKIEGLWPGDAYVDVVGTQFYDRCPPITSDAQFEARVNKRDKWGNPAGPQAWIDWARAKGKKWALPEWGINSSQTICAQPGFDNPFFIRKMHEFLTANAEHVEFESYFNGSDSPTGGSELYPTNFHPRAAAAYKDLW